MQQNDTPESDVLPYALAELHALNQGWPSVAVRGAAFDDLRALADRVIRWRVAVDDAPADATTVWVWTENRLDARELANGDVFAWPVACLAVPPAARGDLLRAACRYEYDHWRRQQPDLLDALRAAEGDLDPAMFGDPAPDALVRWVFRTEEAA